MRKILSELILWLLGWEVIGPKRYPKKCVVIAAPHTSNWDFLIGRCYGYIVGVNTRYLIKSEFFVPILGTLFRWNGGIPVYRDSNNNIVDQITERFNESEELILAITPEGTRSKVEKWKMGLRRPFSILRLAAAIRCSAGTVSSSSFKARALRWL